MSHRNSEGPLRSISNEGAKQLVDQLVILGYFRRSKPNPYVYGHDDCDSFECYQRKGDQPVCGTMEDQEFDLVPTSPHLAYFTKMGLIEEVVFHVREQGGRLDIDTAASMVGVSSRAIRDHATLDMLPASFRILRNTIFSQAYWDWLTAQMMEELDKNGCVNLVDWANNHSIPMQCIQDECLPLLDGVSLIGDSKEMMVSSSYLDSMKANVLKCFRGLLQPVAVPALCEENGWDLDLVLHWIKSSQNEIDGEINVDPCVKLSASFIPNRFKEQQKQDVINMLSTNGYISAKTSGISLASTTNIVSQTSTQATLVGDVIFLDHFLDEIRETIQDLGQARILDLSEYLDHGLLRPSFVREFVEALKFDETQGVALAVNGSAMLVSRKVVQKVRATTIPPLIDAFARSRAKEIFETSVSTSEENDEDSIESRRRSKSKRKKVKGSSRAVDLTAVGSVLPLLTVAKAVLQEIPELDTSSALTETSHVTESGDWDDDDEETMLVIQFCKVAINTPDFRERCEQAVRAELSQLQSRRLSKATLQTMGDAGQVKNVDVMFAESFISYCHWIQVLTKFIRFASNTTHFDGSALEALYFEFLRCICADFTSRMTQYCLYKVEDDTIFSFGDSQNSTVENRFPPFCHQIDPSFLDLSRPCLSCPPPREPLVVLRECLPGTAGILLSQQWILCGEDCYLSNGGTESIDYSTGYERIAKYVDHCAENCIAICGLPFRKLDKKSEKQILNARRQRLLYLLGQTDDSEQILKLSITILFQQVKNLVAVGPVPLDSILKILAEDRKCKPTVWSLLSALKDAIAKDKETVDKALVDAVKECALCRDIARYEVSYRVPHSEDKPS